MANKYQSKKQKTIITKLLLIVVLAVLCAVSLLFSSPIEKSLKIGDYKKVNSADASVVKESDLKVHYIDIGQGDATLIELPDNTTMLIDAGTPDSTLINKLITYLKDEVKIESINYLILTHSDDDHSGGMAEVLKEFCVQNVYRPFQVACKATKVGTKNYPLYAIDEEDLSSYCTYDTDYNETDENGWRTARGYNVAFQNFVKGIYKEKWVDDSDASVTVFYNGLKIESTNAQKPFTFEFFEPHKIKDVYNNDLMLVGKNNKTLGYEVKKYNGKNNSSPIMLLEYKEKSFVFTGDAEKEVEADFVDNYKNDATTIARFSDVDFYKAGHHGSSTSSTEAFLKILNPTYTVCSCGENNSYHHPSEAFLKRWEAQVATQGTARVQSEPFITFKNKTIIAGVDSDGKLAYAVGIETGIFTLRWWYIASGVFIIGSVIIITIKVHKNSAVKTAKSAVRSTQTAKRVYKNFRSGK
ncbi:MAG: MBL fold metallo-hydrolase [Clostridia bacterium]|nr:MBL fold metallo-hydrolase [Clostridia bacterium]